MIVPRRLILLIVAIVLFLVYALTGLGTISAEHPTAWLGFGLVCFAAAFI